MRVTKTLTRIRQDNTDSIIIWLLLVITMLGMIAWYLPKIIEIAVLIGVQIGGILWG